MDRDRLLREVQALETLGGAIRWALDRSPRAEFVNVVIQDEFTQDVVVRVAPNAFVAFDSTWLGAVKAVAFWDHEPGADELLGHRLERGRAPTPTATRDSLVVLGHAACLSLV